MDKKRLEEIKVMVDNARKNLAEEIKTIREKQERLRRHQLLLKALGEVLKENADFKRQYESKLAELIQKEKAAIKDEP